MLPIGAGLVLLLGVGLGTAWALKGDSDKTPAGTPAAVQSLNPYDGLSDTTADPGAQVAPSNGSADQLAPDAPANVRACLGEVRDGESVVTAGASSANDWRIHTQAQVQVDAGKITEAESKKRWADSKSRGPSDVSTFNSADGTYKKSAGSCGRMGEVPADYKPAATACTKRATAQAAVIAAARPINGSWAHHQSMMKAKPHEGTNEFSGYMTMWRSMVNEATAQFAAYDKARASLDRAPACSIS